ncbi:MAG: NAD(P)-dependent oxidoreductase [Verrucomicrobia bacterium]|nr:NAD(P)-dependent oxidoreductase [Verrucomicrobiota bacterium]
MQIGWIGTGVMGLPMCGHMLAVGHDVCVYTRTPARARDLLVRGAQWRESPAAVAAESEIVFSIVGYPSDVESIYLGDDGVVSGLKPGALAIDMTTSEPSLAFQIDQSARAQGAATLDAPVSGGDVGARSATLAIMVGGDRAQFNRAQPLLACLGKTIAYMGPTGSGQHTKISNQILIASTMVGVVESLLYAYKAGLDLGGVIDIVGSGAASSWAINNLGRRIVTGDFEPGFYIKHFVKDMGIALKEAKRMRLSLPGLSLAHQFYVAAMAEGLEDLGTQGLYRVMARINGMDVSTSPIADG